MAGRTKRRIRLIETGKWPPKHHKPLPDRSRPPTLESIAARDTPLPRIEWFRAVAGLGQEDMADIAGISLATYRKHVYDDTLPSNVKPLLLLVARPHPSMVLATVEGKVMLESAFRTLDLANGDITLAHEAVPVIPELHFGCLKANREAFQTEYDKQLRRIRQTKYFVGGLPRGDRPTRRQRRAADAVKAEERARETGLRYGHPDYPRYVCADCGLRASGGKSLGISAYHNGTCPICQQEKPVTQTRDFHNPIFRREE